MVHLGRAVEKDDAYLTLLDDIENVASAVMPTALSLHVGMVAQAWQWNYDVSADGRTVFRSCLPHSADAACHDPLVHRHTDEFGDHLVCGCACAY